MKKKSLATLLSGFLTVSLTGVGFASWLITGGAEKTSGGNITVETVDDRRVSLSDVTAGNGIYFGSNQTGTTGWIRSTQGAKEDLEDTFTFTVTNADYAASIDLELSSETSGKMDALKYCIDKNYIAFDLGDGVEVQYDDSTDTFKWSVSAVESMSLKVKFKWGSYFTYTSGGTQKANVNPYEYFNGKYGSAGSTSGITKPDTSETFATAADEAKFVLEKIAEIGNTDDTSAGTKSTAFTLLIKAVAA